MVRQGACVQAAARRLVLPGVGACRVPNRESMLLLVFARSPARKTEEQ
jgi:hypothetical protein